MKFPATIKPWLRQANSPEEKRGVTVGGWQLLQEIGQSHGIETPTDWNRDMEGQVQHFTIKLSDVSYHLYWTGGGADHSTGQMFESRLERQLQKMFQHDVIGEL